MYKLIDENVMSLIFQDPNEPAPSLLLNELISHFKDADAIYCAFAFVTARGLNLLFNQDEVKANLGQMKVSLLVGMDAITDTKAIEKLSVLCATHENFSAQVFLPRTGGIFHPKFSLVKIGNTGVAITGSGNLTNGGLKTNVEAFAVTQIDQEATRVMEENWAKFLSANSGCLFSLDSNKVIEAAKQNAALKKLQEESARKQVRKLILTSSQKMKALFL